MKIDLDTIYGAVATIIIVAIVGLFAWYWNPGEINYRIERSRPEPRFVRV